MTIGQITLSPSTLVRVLGATAFLLILAQIGVHLTKYLTGHGTCWGIIQLFNLESEGNIPTYFSASLLLVAALLLAVIARLKKNSQDPYGSGWGILSFAFLYMAVDEAAGIHELLAIPTRALLGNRASGILYAVWLIPGNIITFGFALFFLRFFLHLPPKMRLVVMLAATLFIGGAIGVEFVGVRYLVLHGDTGLIYIMAVTLEESLEMSGVIVFIYALLKYIEDNYREVRFKFEDSEGTRYRRPSGQTVPDAQLRFSESESLPVENLVTHLIP